MGTVVSIYDPIDIEKSKADSRSLIMPHQQDAVDAMTAYFNLENEKAGKSGVVVMPTGSGKTYTAVTWLLTQAIAQDYRVVWLVHRQELVEQTFREFRKQAPLLKESGKKRLRVLAVSGAHLSMSRANKADVYVCSIASVANKYGYRFVERMLGSAGKRKTIVVIDEAHHAVAANYQKVLNRIRDLCPMMVLLGLTATPVRMNESEQGRLMRLFNIDNNIHYGISVDGYVYSVTLKQLIESGFLAVPKHERIDTKIVGEIEYNLTEEDKAFFDRFGELSEQLKMQIAKSSARNQVIVKQYLENKKRYGKTLVFAVNQLHAQTLNDLFQKNGVSSDYAISSKPESQQTIEAFKDNKFDVLINVQMMTEGSDVPDIQTVFLTRETNSDSLLMQMIGRGLRGVKANGTEVAYIVAFHDVWDSFAHWLDPSVLRIIDVPPEPPIVGPNPDPPGIEPRDSTDEAKPKPPIVKPDPPITLTDLYLKLYTSIRASFTVESQVFTFPVGWYSLIDSAGVEAISGFAGYYMDILRQVTNDGKETREFTKIIHKLRFPLPMFLEDAFKKKKTTLVREFGLRDSAAKFPLLTHSTQTSHKLTETPITPKELEAYCRKMLKKIEVSPRTIEILLPDKGTVELSNLRRLFNLPRTNFEHHSINAACVEEGDLAYMLSRMGPDILSRHYTGFRSMSMLFNMRAVLERWYCQFTCAHEDTTQAVESTEVLQADGTVVRHASNGLALAHSLLEIKVPKGYILRVNVKAEYAANVQLFQKK